MQRTESRHTWIVSVLFLILLRGGASAQQLHLARWWHFLIDSKKKNTKKNYVVSKCNLKLKRYQSSNVKERFGKLFQRSVVVLVSWVKLLFWNFGTSSSRFLHNSKTFIHRLHKFNIFWKKYQKIGITCKAFSLFFSFLRCCVSYSSRSFCTSFSSVFKFVTLKNQREIGRKNCVFNFVII